nr:NADH dehydrogenase subunit 2 [Tholosanus proximus]QVD38901.1 NADH dehydrogenase subunit 2 [Tholosanus proximus]
MKKSSWLFISVLILSTTITMSANNWISMWMGLELNMMSFIPLILNEPNKSKSEAAMMYFLVQSISSMLLMSMILLNMCKYLLDPKMINMIINISVLIKLGAAPFHLWMPEIMSKLSWINCMILMTWQKLAPMMMISNLNNSLIINISIICSIIIGSLGGINQMSLRKMMGYSSINHLGWMLAINKSMNLWMMYIIIYSILTSMLCYMFNNYKMFFMNQVSNINMSIMEKLSFFIMMLSMGGLPPFMGFLPKWITIQNMMNEKEFMIMFIMIMFSLVNLMYYLRVMTNMYLSFNSTIKWSIMHQNKLMTMSIMIINLSLPMIMITEIM